MYWSKCHMTHTRKWNRRAMLWKCYLANVWLQRSALRAVCSPLCEHYQQEPLSSSEANGEVTLVGHHTDRWKQYLQGAKLVPWFLKKGAASWNPMPFNKMGSSQKVPPGSSTYFCHHRLRHLSSRSDVLGRTNIISLKVTSSRAGGD